MTLFYFHLHECGNFLRDEEGREFADHRAAIEDATNEARLLMASELAEGRLNLAPHIEVVNADTGESVSMPFTSAVRVEGVVEPHGNY